MSHLINVMNILQNILLFQGLYSNKVPMTELCQITGIRMIIDEVHKRDLKWFGHMKINSLPVKAIFEGIEQRRRHPQRRWMDDIRVDKTKMERTEHERSHRGDEHVLCATSCKSEKTFRERQLIILSIRISFKKQKKKISTTMLST